MGDAKRRATAFVAEINELELAARIAEIAMDLKRPPGISGADFIVDAERRAAAAGEPDAVYAVRCWIRMARAAIAYFGERIENGRAPS